LRERGLKLGEVAFRKLLLQRHPELVSEGVDQNVRDAAAVLLQ